MSKRSSAFPEPVAPADTAPPASQSSDRRRRAWRATRADLETWSFLAVAAVLLGCVLRLLRWTDDPALWLDEALLSLNLVNKPFEELFEPLQFLQSGPPGFLVVEKAAETIIGDAERSLRLFPALASVVSVPLFGYLGWRLLAPPAAVLAIALFSVSEPLLEHAAEVKPYSVDVFATLLLVALCLRVLNAPEKSVRSRFVALAIVGPLALWVSFPAAFTLASVVVALGVHGFEGRSRAALTRAAVLAVVSLVSVAAVYTVASSTVSSISSRIFAAGDDASSFGRFDTIQNAWSTLVNPGGFDNGTNGLAALLACFGVIALVRRGSLHYVVLLTLPLLLAASAAFLNRYPLGGRFSLFLTPFLLILVARGTQALAGWSRRPLLVAGGLAVFLVTSPLALAAKHMADPPAREDIKPLLRVLAAEWRPGDSLYVYGNSQYALRYYSQCQECSISGDDFPWPTRIAPDGPPDQQFAPALESIPPTIAIGEGRSDEQSLAELRRRSERIWLLFSHVNDLNGLDPERFLVATLENGGEPLDVTHSRGGRLYLFDSPEP